MRAEREGHGKAATDAFALSQATRRRNCTTGSQRAYEAAGNFRAELLIHLGSASHSWSFDHRRRPEMLRTAIATAFFWPTSPTSFLPRVTPVERRVRCSMA